MKRYLFQAEFHWLALLKRSLYRCQLPFLAYKSCKLEWSATSAQNIAPFSRGSEWSWVMKGLGSLTVWYVKAALLTLLYCTGNLHWLLSLLEFQQCSKNHDTCSFSNSSKPSLVLVPADTYLCTLVSTDETRAIGHLSPWCTALPAPQQSHSSWKQAWEVCAVAGPFLLTKKIIILKCCKAIIHTRKQRCI